MAGKQLMKGDDDRMYRRKETSLTGMNTLSIFGVIALIGTVVLFVLALPDIKRYIKISTM